MATKLKLKVLLLSANLLALMEICYIAVPKYWPKDTGNFVLRTGVDNGFESGSDKRSTRISHSYNLWQSIRLHPEDTEGRSPFHRYGDPLPLYQEPVNIRIEPTRTEHWPFVKKSNAFVNCSNLFLTNQNVPDAVQNNITTFMKNTFNGLLKQANMLCKTFIDSAGYITKPLTNMEAEFPIAFSLLIYKDIEQFEILLRTIYRPQNIYCVHVDKKSTKHFHSEVDVLVGCFDNVFMTSFSVDVRWSMFTNLEPEVICLRELWKNRVKWKYFINLTGQEFPLRTNYELVKILMAYGGANNVEANYRWPNTERLVNAGPVPYGLTPVKGQVHVTLSREFVDFLLHNETSLALYDWSRNVRHPDEIYFSTLNYNRKLRAPGSYRGMPKSSIDDNPFITRLKHWIHHGYSCHGRNVRSICIFGTKDLPLLATREELFANKLNFGYHSEVMLCMQELLYNRTAEEYEGSLEFNVTYYKTRDFVKNRF